MLEIKTIEVALFPQNARVLICTETKQAVVVDPGGDVNKILNAVEDEDLKISEVWLTHSHLDHCGGVKELIELTGAKLYGHKLEKEYRASIERYAMVYGLPAGSMQDCPEPDVYIDEGDQLSLGEHKFDVLFTPGHSPGHVCFYNPKESLLIAGDTVFAGSIGRTDLPGGNYQVLMDSIRAKILSLPGDTKIMPGHGPDTTVDVEKRTNPFLS